MSADIYADPEGITAHILGYAEICAELQIPYLHHTVASDIFVPHLTDTELGCGCIDLAAVKTAFHDIGYTGMYAMEFTPRAPGELERALERFME